MGINAIFSELHSKRKSKLCGDSVEFVNVKRGCADNKHWVLKV
jgi:hypothetical protein